MQNQPYTVAALYCFTTLANFKEVKENLEQLAKAHHLCGTLLVAEEGINGTVAGTRKDIDALKAFLLADARFKDISYKESSAQNKPFLRLKVRLKKEIVSLKQPGVSPTKQVGTYVKPKDWNALISDPEVCVIDTRNDYEVQIGTFQNAIDPNTQAFSEFPEFVKKHFDPKKHKKVAMFCTGGIRCEKASSYMLKAGFENVYHLQGGILKYLEEVPEHESLWKGECFVFDNRVAVGHALKEGTYELCHGCRMPLSQQDKAHADFVAGVQCHKCKDVRTKEQKRSATERQRQIQIAKAQGRSHLGSPS